MMAEKVEPDIFKPPHYKLRKDIETKLEELLKEYHSQFLYTGDSKPVSQKPYPIAMKHYKRDIGQN